MAEKVMVSEQYLQDVADSIRTKLKTEDKYTPSEFSSKIDEMNIAPPITKGIIINECDEEGYAKDVSVMGITEIPNYAFGAYDTYWRGFLTKGLTNVHLPDDLTKIGNYAFQYCGKLALTELPDGITYIGSAAFNNCIPLALTNLPEGLTELGSTTFNGCTNLALTSLPEGLTSISSSAFRDCKNITLTSLPSGVTSINNYAFQGCSNITLTSLPEGLTKLYSHAFKNCTNLALTSLPSNLTSLPEYVFDNCRSNKLTEIPANITTIGQYAFQYNTSIKEITCLGDIKSFGNACFAYAGIYKFCLPNVTAVPTLGSSAFISTPLNTTGVIYVPDDLVESFKTATNWSTYAKNIKPITLTSIELDSSDYINTYINNYTPITITYNGGKTAACYPEQEGYTISVNGNATINDNVLTLTDDAQAGDIITVTVTSTYDNTLSATKEIKVGYYEIDVTYTSNTWVDSGTKVHGNTVYKSNGHDYGARCYARINVKGITKLVLYIRRWCYSDDYMEAFEVDTTATRGKGKFKAVNSQTNYTECVYELDGGEHYIYVLYSKYTSSSSYDDCGYFYIGGVE